MIVDVHSHAWEYPGHFTDDFRNQAIRARAGVEVDLSVRYEDYRKTAPPETKTIVFGGSWLLNTGIPSLLSYRAGLGPVLAFAISNVFVYVAWNYPLNRWWVFEREEPPGR